LETRLCPKAEDIEKFDKIMNGYTNREERISFQIEMVKCDPKYQTGCETDEEKFKKVFNRIFFTLLYVEEAIEFGNP